MTSADFGLPRRAEKEYAAAIRRIVNWVLEPVGGGDLGRWLEAIASRSQSPEVREASEELARRMVNWASVRNARTWREAASRVQRSSWLHAQLRGEMSGAVGSRVSSLVRENAAYISSIPLDCAEILAREVTTAQQQGARAATIAKAVRRRFPELLKSRVTLIARTETSKASAALTKARAEALGLPWYIWRSSEDNRVRTSHRKMDGVLVAYSDPPSPEALVGIKSTLGRYHAGDAPNDRCTQIVLLSLDDVKFPRRVHWHGTISSMNKQQFMQLRG